MVKNRKGISLTTMVITVMIMLIIMGTLVYSATDSVKIRKINKLYDDLRRLGDSVEVYYLKNGELPIDTGKTEITVNINETKETVTSKKLSFVLKNDQTKVSGKDSFFNPNDYNTSSNNATYKFLKLDLLSNLSLNYPKNDYIINTQSHTIYSFTGLKVGDKTYNSLPIKYKDTGVNTIAMVNGIRVREIEGVSNSNEIYFSTDSENINLRDYLIFDSSENDGLGEPKEVTFTPVNNDYFSVNKEGILTVTNKDIPDGGDNSLTVNVSATNYGNDSAPTKTFRLYASSIDLCQNSNSVDHINLVKEQTSPTYVYSKTSTGETDYKIKKMGYINSKNNFDLTSTSENNEVASATYNSKNSASEKYVVFNSGEKAGTTDLTIQTKDYGLAKDTIKVNVFNFEIYEGSAGSNTNIEKLNFGGIGDSQKTNVKLNFEAPEEFKFDGNSNNVKWSIVKDDRDTLDDSEIVKLTQDSDETKATITPFKIGTTNLKCVVTIEGEKLVEMIVPITVSGIQRQDNQEIIDDTIILQKNIENTVNLKYVFGDNSITSYSFETPTIIPSDDFVVVKNEDNTFSVTYNGKSEVTAILEITVLVGNDEYKDTMNITISN